MPDPERIPLFSKWKHWYVFVLVIHFLLIALFWLITQKFNIT